MTTKKSHKVKRPLTVHITLRVPRALARTLRMDARARKITLTALLLDAFVAQARHGLMSALCVTEETKVLKSLP